MVRIIVWYNDKRQLRVWERLMSFDDAKNKLTTLLPLASDLGLIVEIGYES